MSLSPEQKFVKSGENDLADDIADRFVDALDQEVIPDEVIEEYLLKQDRDKTLNNPTIVDLPPENADTRQTRPGVVWVSGINHEETNSSAASTAGDLENEDLTSSLRFSTGISLGQHEEYLVEAETVAEDTSSRIIIDAKPVPWWRRNQWWITATIVAIAVGITLLVVFLIRDQRRLDDPTMSPTTFEDGLEKKIFDLIISNAPQAEENLVNHSTPQYEALRWITEKAQDNPSFYTDRRLLQQYSLSSFFFATGASSKWNMHSVLTEYSDECKWYGVECGKKGSNLENMITSIHIPAIGISGTLPNDLSILSSSLSSLVISGNSLTGSIPYTIGQLTLLTNLELSGNELSGSIPKSIGELTSLLFMDLSQNVLGSTIPDEVGALSALLSIRFGNNKLVGSIPPHIGKLTLLQEIDFQTNNLSYDIPTEIGQLSLLQTLNLKKNKLLGPLPSALSSLMKLKTLDLSGNYIFSTIPKIFWQPESFPSLENLDLSNNLLTGTLPSDFGTSWTRLKKLCLGGRNFLEGTIPGIIYALPDLEELDISSNFLTGTISDLSRLSKLETLTLSNNNLHGKLPDSLYQLPKLQLLHLSGNSWEGTLSSSIGSLSNLAAFHVSGVSGSIPLELWSLTNLQSLDFTDTALSGNVTSEIAQMMSLSSINFLGNINLLGTIPSEIGLMTSLTRLHVATNSFHGTIPTEIGLLSGLDSLDLNANKLSGMIPTELQHAISLTNLKCGVNMMTGTIPTQIGLLTNLKVLWLGHTNFSGSIPSEIGKLTEMEELRLRNTDLEGTLPSEIHSMIKLTLLQLFENAVRGDIPDELCRLTPEPEIYVECDKVNCLCCGCPQNVPSPTLSWSPIPTQPVFPTSFSTYNPSLVSTSASENRQTTLPSFLPSSTERFCSDFTPIASHGTLLSSFDESDHQILDLPFTFAFNAAKKEEYQNITVVRSKGKILMGSEEESTCSRIIVGAIILENHVLPLEFQNASVYSAYNEIEDSLTLSWEDENEIDQQQVFGVNFQIVLFGDGRIEIRWGNGIYPSTHQLLAVVTIQCMNIFFPIRDGPFVDIYGPVLYTDHGIWPSHMCADFSPGDVGYTVNTEL